MDHAADRLNLGVCETCGQSFRYRLIHNGFDDSAFAYCDECGRTAILSCWCNEIPEGVELEIHGPVNSEAEALLEPCSCGGRFRASASPRCPRCRSPLSAEMARSYLEANASGTGSGWCWQTTWDGTYSIVIEDNLVKDNWKGP